VKEKAVEKSVTQPAAGEGRKLDHVEEAGREKTRFDFMPGLEVGGD